MSTLGEAILERVEDKLADAIAHVQQPDVIPGEALITIKAKIKFSNDRSKMEVSIEEDLKPCKREPFTTIVYGGLDEDGDARAVQAEMRGVGYQINPIPEGSLNYIRKQAINLHDRTTKRDRKRGTE